MPGTKKNPANPIIATGTKLSNYCRRLSLAFASGCIGAVATCGLVWAFDYFELARMLGFHWEAKISLEYLAMLTVLGGAWGMVAVLPIFGRPQIRDGLIWSIGPSFTMLLVVMPLREEGIFGLELGKLTPLVVGILSLIWGVCTATWLRLVGEPLR